MNIKIRQPQCFTEIGRKDNQEDFLWPSPQEVTANCRVFLMCDGVGGQDHGEVASRTAATALGTYLTEHFPEDGLVTKALFGEALDYAYDQLDQVDADATSQMGTTMTCLVLHDGGVLIAHIGDSRVYQVRPSLADKSGRTGIIYQSTDHSLVNDLLRAGEISEEEAAHFPHKNVITRAMQPHQERRSKADVFCTDDVQGGDYFFLCCDGVLEQLTNDLLGSILADDTLDDEGKIKAIKAVCDGKTRDNYTCWLIPVDAVEGESLAGSDDEMVATVVEQETQRPAGKESFGQSPRTGGKPAGRMSVCGSTRFATATAVKGKFRQCLKPKWTIMLVVLCLCVALAAMYFFFYAKGLPFLREKKGEDSTWIDCHKSKGSNQHKSKAAAAADTASKAQQQVDTTQTAD